ncbi:MAG: hypothetical protein U0835_08415 [Isosphaeraceae bacterium]
MPARRPRSCLAFLTITLAAAGCNRAAEGPTPAPEPAAAAPVLGEADQAAYQKLETGLNKLIGQATIKYASLRYEYSEGLLKSLDRIEKHVSDRPDESKDRLMPGLDPAEELAHFKESVRRWEAKSGKKMRAEVDRLLADVAARKPGEAFHPDFQRKFSQTFDDFIRVEVEELRERRNRAIHEEAARLFEPYRTSNPEAVRRAAALIDTPQYSVPAESKPAPNKTP